MSVYFSSDEQKLLKEMAKKSGISVSKYIRDKVFGGRIEENDIYSFMQEQKAMNVQLQELLKAILNSQRLSTNISAMILFKLDPEGARDTINKIRSQLEVE